MSYIIDDNVLKFSFFFLCVFRKERLVWELEVGRTLKQRSDSLIFMLWSLIAMAWCIVPSQALDMPKNVSGNNAC